MSESSQGLGSAACAFRLRGVIADREVVLLLHDGLNHLGSADGNELVLEHEGISRHHAIVVVDKGRVGVVDCESRNGTFVDERRVERANLHVGSMLRLGPHALRLEAVAPADAVLALEWSSSSRVLDSREVSLGARPTKSGVAGNKEIGRAEIGHAEAGRAGVGDAGVPDAGVPDSGLPGAETGDAAMEDQATRVLPRPGYPRFELVSSVARSLAQPAGAGRALCDVASFYRATSAHLCLLGSQVEMLASWGSVRSERLLRIHENWPGHDSLWRFSIPDAFGCVLRVGPESAEELGLALIVLDAEAEGEWPQEVGTLLSLFVLWRNRLGPQIEAQESTLRFPAGYIVGRAAETQKLHRQLRQLAPGDLPILITGETGVGKEWVARILHESSPRREAPLVAINCAAIPAELLEAELFGIGKNVATGVAPRAGRFQEADGGTLFLDEVSEMPAALQAKLLRVLQEGRVEPLGAPPREIDVRLLAATNADVFSMVDDGRFRRDLYFRLAGYVLEVPPLRQRRDDIPLFVEHLIRINAEALGKGIRGITLGALRALMAEDWPGNIRELEHQVRRLVHLCPDQAAIDSTSLSAGRGKAAPPPQIHIESSAYQALEDPPVDLDLAEMEGKMIREALRRSGENQVQAAKLLGISRYSLRRRINRLGLG